MICLFAGSGPIPVSYPVWLGLIYVEVQRPKREAHHSPPQNSDIKNDWSCIAIPPCAFMPNCLDQRLRWSRGSVLAFGTQVHGFKPGRSRRTFQDEKILSTPSFGREVKPFVPCRIFAACKRTRKCMRGSRSFRSKLPDISRPSSSFFHCQGLWWRHLAVQVGTTKDQGLYNKPQAAVHPGALAGGTLPENNTIIQIMSYLFILSLTSYNPKN